MKISDFVDKLRSFVGLFLFVLCCCNFYLAFRVSSVVNLKSVVVTNVVEIASLSTNFLSSVSSSNFPSLSILPPSTNTVPEPVKPRQVFETSYQYFLCSRRIGAYMFGRPYYEGSPCSYGRISQIYPDRIILSSGDWISNTFDQSTRKVNKHDF